MSQIGLPPCDEGVVRCAEPPTSVPASVKRWVLIAAILGSSMAFIDGTIVNVALPAIQHDLAATAAQMQWVVEAYALFLAALLLVGGALGDRYGRRRIFMVGVALFAIASIGCALSTRVELLILARALQGIGGALLVPGSLTLISAVFPEQERGRAIGTWSGFSGITAAFGPVAGGWLVDHYDWTWAFYINIPLATAVLYVAWRHVPESRGTAARRLDVKGAVLATIGLLGIVYAFIEAPVRLWNSPAIAIAMLAGCASLGLFILAERRQPFPMVPMSLFRNRNFAGANLLTLWLYAALGGGLYFFPLNLIQAQGYSAAAAGAALLPFIFIMFILSRWAGRLVDRFGPRLPLVVGPLIAGAGFALFAVPGIGGIYWTTFFPAVVILGLGMSVTVAPLTTTVMNAVDQGSAGIASGVNNAVSRTAALLAIAAFGMVMAAVYESSLRGQLAALEAAPETVSFLMGQVDKLAGSEIPAGMDAGSAADLEAAIRGAYVAGFRWIMLLSAGLAVLSAAAAWVLIGGRSAQSPHRA